MVSSLNINPSMTTNAAGSFRNLSDGFIQGIAMDDPAIRNELAGGVLSGSEALPMWGGVGICELVPPVESANTRLPNLGGTIRRASSLAGALNLTGFSVFDQAHHMLQTPQSPVPLALANMSVHFYRLGCGMRIPVKCDPALASLRNGVINPQVSWDFAGQQLVSYQPVEAAIAISGVTWSGGIATFTSAAQNLVPGNTVNVSGILPVGYNGDFVVATVPDTTHFTVAMPVNPGTYVSGGQIDPSGGALNVRVLNIRSDNCKTVTYDPVSGYATWNDNGCCALLLI